MYFILHYLIFFNNFYNIYTIKKIKIIYIKNLYHTFTVLANTVYNLFITFF